MCGIIAVVSRRSTRPFVDPVEVLARLDSVAVSIADDPDAALSVLRSVDAALRGVPGVTAGDVDPGLTTSIVARLPVLEAVVDVLETRLGDDVGPDDPDTARVTGLRDVLWAIRHDRVRTIDAVLDLAGRSAGSAAIAAYLSVQQALSALDRLEVRGRD
ncbi:MAG: glucosamine-6-phosphate synthase, partial [Ilumatobacteraceae bacterium]